MDKVVDVYVNGEKHNALIITVFTIENRTFCMYAIPQGNGKFIVKCGKKIGDEVVDIEDDNERKIMENITKTIILGQKKEDLLNMADENAKFSIIDDKGEERDAFIVGEYEIEGNNYIVYAIAETEDASGLYIKKIIYNEAGEEEAVVSITDPKERDIVFAAMKEYINSEVGEE